MSLQADPIFAKILVADDDPILCEVASSTLSEAGHTVDIAADGAVAIKHLKRTTYDLAMIDIDMPAHNGFEVISHMRGNPLNRYTPAIVVTSNDDVGSIERAFNAGATSFLSKPVNWKLFVHHVQYVLKSSQKERELRNSKNIIAQLSQMKSDLLSVVTHEFRTPLHTVVGFAGLLAREVDGPLGAKQYRDYVAHISEAAGRLNTVLSDMLLLTRALSHDLGLQEDEYSFSRVIGYVIDQVSEAASKRGIRIDKQCNSLCDIQLYCDLALLRRALWNLLDNALKFSSDRSSVIVDGELTPDGALMISVTDEGAGMTEGQIEDAIKPFLQADMSRTRPGEGMGVGLTIAKHLIELHGGRLLIESEIGVGTTARILLPAERISTITESAGSEVV